MDSIPSELIGSIITHLKIDEIAYFSLASKSLREYTKQCKTIDISRIINYHSKKEFVSILKILRFHPFRAWIFPESELLFEHEISSIIMNMIQRTKSIIKSITFTPSLTYSQTARLFLHYYASHPLLSRLSVISSLQHLTNDSIYIDIPSSILQKHRQTLISITSSCNKTSQFLSSTHCFPNLESLTVQHHAISDHVLPVRAIFGNGDAKFCRLKQLTLRKQCISLSFRNMLSIIASLPVLIKCCVEYCRFRIGNKSKYRDTRNLPPQCNNYKPSNSLKSLYFNTISIRKRSLLHIADCFAESLETIHFNQCVLPIAVSTWAHFATKCDYIQTIRCDDTCLSMKVLSANGWNHQSGLWLQCKRDNDTSNALHIALDKAFQNRHNVVIDINAAQNKKIIQYDADYIGDGVHRIKNQWRQPQQYDVCELCGVKVAAGFMEDHVDNICSNALVKCTLCEMDDIKRCEMTKHWDNDCIRYEYMCNECFIIFNDRTVYCEHANVHKIRDDHCRKEFHFGNIHSTKYRDAYCDKRSIELAWKCTICERRCTGAKSEHKCPKECIDWSYYNWYNICELCNAKVAVGKMTDHLDGICANKIIRCNLCKKEFPRKQLVGHWNSDCAEYTVSETPLSMMMLTVPSLYSKRVVRYWIRNEIEKQYKLYGSVPDDILLLISTFYVSGHNFTAHKEEHRVFNVDAMRMCPMCPTSV